MNRIFSAIILVLVLASVTEAQTSDYELGARFWNTSGETNFAFSFDNSFYGDPTSTIDWINMSGRTGEIFARMTQRRSGVYVKGLLGVGKISNGNFIDRDFYSGQVKFSDFSSHSVKGNTSYAIVDVGISRTIRKSRVGAFIGYNRQHDSVTSYGMYDNIKKRDFPGYDTDIANVVYEPTWHLLRLGLEANVKVAPKWSANAEMAWTPTGHLVNNDSHLLRTSKSDYGPSPNVVTSAVGGHGNQSEISVNYSVSKNTEVGFGARFWTETMPKGVVEIGPTFVNYPLRKFAEHRYGLTIELKRRF